MTSTAHIGPEHTRSTRHGHGRLSPTLGDLYGYWSYMPQPLPDCSTMFFGVEFLWDPPDGWTVHGWNTPGLKHEDIDTSMILVRQLNPPRIWKLTAILDYPDPISYGYQGIWPD